MNRLKNLLFAFGILMMVSCDHNISPDTELIGIWTWVSSSGGFAGTTETPATTGEEVTIEFSKNRFKKFVNGDLIDDLRYSIKLDKSIYSTEKTAIITFKNGWKQSYSITEDTLRLNDECYDCYQYAYVRN